MEPEQIIINLRHLFGDRARLVDLPDYLEKVLALAGEGNNVILTGRAPVWLYLAVAHKLHGLATKLTYRSPVTGDVVIFDHTPF